MFYQKGRGLLAGSLVLLSACTAGLDGVSSDPSDFVLATDRESYTAAVQGSRGSQPVYGFTVIAVFTNHAERTAYLARCVPSSPVPDYYLELINGSDPHGSAYNQVCAGVGHDQQIPVAPGRTRTDTLHVVGPNLTDGITSQPIGTLVGQMRLFYQVQTCRGDGACVVQGAGKSNEFSVALQP